MSANRNVKRSVRSLGIVAIAAWLLPAVTEAQSESAQRAFQSGRYDEALNGASENRDDPANVYLASQAALRLDQNDRAREEYGRLESLEDGAWKAVGRAARALLDGNTDEAVNAGTDAVNANGDNPYAHYQLGMALGKAGDHGRAGEEFARAAELKGDLAYAHYFAGLEYQRAKQGGKAGDHLRRFLDLAPDAPERNAVQTLLRSLRG